MEEVIRSLQAAQRALTVADHMAYVTYPLVKDIKLLVAVLNNLDHALTEGMNAALYYDRLYKRIPPLPEHFHLRMDLFKRKTAPRYGIGREFILLLEDVRAIIEHRNQSPIEFTRKDKLVICSSTYRMKVITYDAIKDYLRQSKLFMDKIMKVCRFP